MSCGQAGEAKPELLNDWDQRLVVTTLMVQGQEGEGIELNQVAEKDQVSQIIGDKKELISKFIIVN